MTDAECWQIIDRTVADSGADVSRQASLIIARLVTRPAADIVHFSAWVRQKMLDANTPQLLLVTEWVYARQMGLRVSGDEWEYQRGWYVSRGSSHFQSLLDNADVVADLFNNLEDSLGGEAIELAANYAYQRVTGQREGPAEMYQPSLIESWPAKWLANEMDAETLRRQYPRMSSRFGDPDFARCRRQRPATGGPAA